MGQWEGSKFVIREFPASPARGTVKNVEFFQTLGKMTLKYVLPGQVVKDLSSKDLVVELSSEELRVQTDAERWPDLQDLLGALCGDLYGHVRRDLSWWSLDEEDGGVVFRIELGKRDHKAWSSPWKAGLSHHRKQHFARGAEEPSIKKATEMLVKVKSGRPAQPDADPFVINRESLCIGVEEGQVEDAAFIRIHLDQAALDKACEKTQLAYLFGVDVMEKYLKIFIRGDDRSPIMMGELDGSCIPQQTSWEFVKAKQDSGCMGLALQVKIVKSPDSRKEWQKILHENTTMLQRECASSLEELDKRGLRQKSPDRTNWTSLDYAKEAKCKGDASFKKGECRDACVYYTRAINHAPDDEKLYSNRSACYMKQKKYEKALEDASKSISINQSWTKAYFRQGQALRGLQRWEDAINAFAEGRFRDPANPEWEKEIQKTQDEREVWDQHYNEMRQMKREADRTAELNEATTVAERKAMVAVAEQAIKAGKSKHEAGQLAIKGAEMAKKQIHDIAAQKRKQAEAMMLEGDKELDSMPPYRIVNEDGSVHSKGFAHTEKGQYYLGMTMMNYVRAPRSQPWIEIYHPARMRWTQGCAKLILKVQLPATVKSASQVEVSVTTTHLRIGTRGDSDPIIVGNFERRVEPEGDNYSWFLVPDEKPPMLEMSLDKDMSEIYQTFSYATLLWPRLFSDDISLGEGLFEADLTDLPPHLLEKFQREQARSTNTSVDERTRRKLMTEEEISEETARNWNDEFARHGMPYRMDTNEDKFIQSLQYK